jgi:RNA polymerase sigma-70 factor (ECF subfamily)
MIPKNKRQAPGLSDPRKWVDLHGDQLYRYAFARVQNRMVAEDLVQDTFLAALDRGDEFEGRSSEKTWLTAILKHKIIDYFRKLSKEQPMDKTQDHQKQADDFFNENGSWMDKPDKWDLAADELLDRKEFWKVFSHCLSELSERTRMALNLREMEGLGCDEICKILGVSASNCWTMLHRARMLLRRCLQVKWFGTGERSVSLDV